VPVFEEPVVVVDTISVEVENTCPDPRQVFVGPDPLPPEAAGRLVDAGARITLPLQAGEEIWVFSDPERRTSISASTARDGGKVTLSCRPELWLDVAEGAGARVASPD
jgi:hypothetical protein